MDRTGYSNMGPTQANRSKQDKSRSLAAVPMVDGGGPDGISHCDPHVPASAQASLRAHRLWNNGMTLSVLSAERLTIDPWRR